MTPSNRRRAAPFVTTVALLATAITLGNRAAPNRPPSSTPTLKLSESARQTLRQPAPVAPPLTKDRPATYALGYVLLDHDSKYPLAAKNAEQSVPIASTTKIMTALLAIETLPADKIVAITTDAAAVEGSKADFFIGEKLTVRSLLFALMLNSANNAAIALSQAGGTTDDFVAAMNQRAVELGLSHTHFLDPAGLNDGGRSTPRELALLLDYALSNSTFATLVSTPKMTVESTDGRFRHELTNSNRLIRPDEPLYLAAVIGGKTGFTYDAGHCLVAAAQFGSKRYVTAVLHTNADTNDASAYEARKLLNWAGGATTGGATPTS